MVAKVAVPETTISPEMTNGLNITRMEHEEKNGLTRTHIAFWQGFIYPKKSARGTLRRSRLFFAEKQTHWNSFKIEMGP